MKQVKQIKSSVEIRKMARRQLKGKWNLGILLTLIYWGILVSCSILLLVALSYIGLIIDFVMVGALTLGLNSCFLKIACGEKIKIENIFIEFKNFGSAFLLKPLIIIFTLLWAVIAMIPLLTVLLLIVLVAYINKDASYGGFYDVIYPVAIIIAASIGFFILLIPAVIAQYRYSMLYYILNGYLHS